MAQLMGEDRKLLLLITASLFISATSVFLSEFDLRKLLSDLTVTYRAQIEVSESLTLEEVYVFRVREEDRFRMLFRNWKAPVVKEGYLGKPFLRVVTYDGDRIAYLKDHMGNIYLSRESFDAYTLVEEKALRNELGILSVEGFGRGSYRASFRYEVFPPVEFDERNTHVNLKLADSHLYYERVEIVIDDRANVIERVFPHLPDFSLERRDRLWIVEGIAPTDSLVEIEILMRPVSIAGFSRYVVGVEARTLSANSLLEKAHRLRSVFKPVLVLYVLSIPFGLLLLYRRLGSEKAFTVPEYLSYVPNPKRKPWEVNLLFKGNATRADENAFYATLIDLERKGFIEVKITGEDIRIKNLGKVPEDIYEINLLSFIEKYSYYGGGELSSKEIKRLLDSYVEDRNRYGIEKLKRDFEEVFEFKGKKFVKEFLDTRGHRLIKRLGIGVSALILLMMGTFLALEYLTDVYIYDLFILSTAGIVLSLAPGIFLHPQVFGRWKESFYKEKLEWEAFRNFLSDMAMLQKYAPEDVSVWKEWLIYATALGVADKVEEVMDKLKVKIPELGEKRLARYHWTHLYHSIGSAHSSVNIHSTSQGGGGFGTGGGFGGGGAGGR